jgi:hypothetical protein
MKLTRSMLYYFWSWIICLPIVTFLNFAIDGNVDTFLTLTGCFAYFQLFILGLRYFILKIVDAFRTRKKRIKQKVIVMEKPTAFALMFSEENKLGGGTQQ